MGKSFVTILFSIALLTIVETAQRKADLYDTLVLAQSVKQFNGTWLSDTELYSYSSVDGIVVYNVITRTSKILVSSVELPFGEASITLSSDNKKVLIRYDPETVFRHSSIAKYNIYDIETRYMSKIANGTKLSLCMWSPADDKLAYVLNNNIFVRYANGKEVQLTRSGVNGVIYNGIPDWVYEEEVLGSGKAMWFSPDGKKLAAAYFNDTNVRTYTYQMYGDAWGKDLYPEELHLKYPKVGTKNPNVHLQVIDLDAPKSNWTQLKAPIEIVSKDNILRSVTWSDKDHVLASWTNRRQNLMSMQSCTTKGHCTEVAQLAEPDGWIIANEPQCLSNGRNCLMINWIKEWLQVWNLDLEIGANIWEQMGNFTVQTIYKYNETTGDLFYQATTEHNVHEVHVYKNRDCLSCSLKDSNGDPCKHASASFSKSGSFYALTCKGPTPPYTSVYNTATGEKIIDWELNSDLRELVYNYIQPTVKFMKIPTDDGLYISVKLHIPPRVHPHARIMGNKHPLIIDVYGGPNNVKITNTFPLGLGLYYATVKNTVYAIVEPRGSGNKGKDNVYILNNKLGTVEPEDVLTAAKFLQKNLKFIDANRTSVWGWSYGGYTTGLTIARDDKDVFKCGISVAPVVNWLYYDSIYTERFMGLPTEEDNLENYIQSDISRSVYNFAHHDYFLIHGSADDNVHVQQTMILAKALQEAGIVFQEMIYPDQAHGISNTYMHVMRSIEAFWDRCFFKPNTNL